MPKDKEDEIRDRFRKREREQEEEQEEATRTGHGAQSGSQVSSSEQLVALVTKTVAEIERVHALYRQYFSGFDLFPPIQARKELERLMGVLTGAVKPTPAYRFRVAGVQSRFNTYRDLWDKQLKELEAGKSSRKLQPMKKGPSEKK